MSNWRKAYGWSGHILTSDADYDSNPDHNLVSIPDHIFLGIWEAASNLRLDERIQIEEIGIQEPEGYHKRRPYFLASGSPATFSEGFQYYGTIFAEADLRASPGPQAVDHDAEYLAAMKEIYGLNLPPCKLMVGCFSEH